MNKTARLITTLDCNRDCHYCCNTPEMLASAKTITDLSALDSYSEVCITGGEPMLYPEKTYEIFKKLLKKNRKIYLYTALATTGGLFQMLMGGLNGIHYTLHYNSDYCDTIVGIGNIERLSKEFPTSKSFRLYIDPKVKHSVTIHPELWDRIESFPFMVDCPLPEHEELFILSSEAKLLTF